MTPYRPTLIRGLAPRRLAGVTGPLCIADMVIGALDVQLEDVETVFVTGCAPGCLGKDGKRVTP